MDWNNLDIFFEEKCLGKAPQVTGWSLEEYLENMISARKNVLLEKLEEISLRNGNRQAIVVCTATGQKNKFAKSFGVEEGSFEEIFFENSKGGSAYLAQIPGRNIDIIGWLYVIPFFRTSKGRLSFEEQRGYATALRSILMEKGAKVDLNLLGANYWLDRILRDPLLPHREGSYMHGANKGKPRILPLQFSTRWFYVVIYI